MSQFNINRLLPKIIKIASFVVIIWVIFLLGRSIWQNWLLRQSIEKLNEQIVTLEKEKKGLNNLIIYYQSDTFKELEARKKLGLKKPGEKVVILPSPDDSSSSNFLEEVKEEQKAINSDEEGINDPNWILWWQYLTK